jgi:2-(1,2-epoxy-1,2-dihydrophenyl)acetyl-CoA isomerase
MLKTNTVLLEQSAEVATITLNRPEMMNAMTDELMRGITEAMSVIENNEDIRVVILTGAGRGFCAGADLVQVAQPNANTSAKADKTGAENLRVDYFCEAMRAVMNSPVPTIARVNGPAAGGGFGLALACDITVAAHSAFFVATFGPNLGIVPDMGATWSIPQRVGRARALGITLLGDRISAEKALQWGMIWDAVHDDDLDSRVNEIASTLSRSSPSAARRTRQSVDAAIHNTFSQQLDLEMTHQAVLIPRNMRDGAEAFLAKRTAKFDGNRT